MKDDRRKELIKIYRDGLLHNTLPFWFPSSVDKEHGGFITSRDRDGTILDDDKGCLLYTSPSPRDATLSRMPSSA